MNVAARSWPGWVTGRASVFPGACAAPNSWSSSSADITDDPSIMRSVRTVVGATRRYIVQQQSMMRSNVHNHQPGGVTDNEKKVAGKEARPGLRGHARVGKLCHRCRPLKLLREDRLLTRPWRTLTGKASTKTTG